MGFECAIGIADAIHRELLVADEPIDPRVDNVDFQTVVHRVFTAEVASTRYGGFPQNTHGPCGSTGRLRHDLNIAQVEHQAIALCSLGDRQRPGIGCGAGEMLDAAVRMLVPRDQGF